MVRTVHAILIGINDYAGPVRPLRGCVNDVQRMEAFIRERVIAEHHALRIKVLLDASATRAAVIAALEELASADQDDVAIFYFSGHGSQQQSPPEFWHLEPDRLDETLVCHDSRTSGAWDLADKELGQLLARIGARCAHVVVVLDCCHSGSATRGDDVQGRRIPADQRVRPLSSFIVRPDEMEWLAGGSATRDSGSRGILAKLGGSPLVMTACRDDELAKELTFDGIVRGVFSYALNDALHRVGASITYHDLFKRISSFVRNSAADQHPQIEAADASLLHQPFLGGAITAPRPHFTLSYSRAAGSWMIDGGMVHGILPPDGVESTVLAVFPLTQAGGAVAQPFGEAYVTEVMPGASRVRMQFLAGQADVNQTYRAVILATPLKALHVLLEGESAALDLVRIALRTAGVGGKASSLTEETSIAATADVRAVAANNRYRLFCIGEDRDLVPPVRYEQQNAAALVVQHLEHIARWRRLIRMENRSGDLENLVRVELIPTQSQTTAVSLPTHATAETPDGLALAYTRHDGFWRRPSFRIAITNTSGAPLYCSLIVLSQNFAVSCALLPGGGVWLQPGQQAWGRAGHPIECFVRDELWERGVTETTDIIKLIASTEQFDATLLDQVADPLPPRATERSASLRSTLDRVLARVATREIALGGAIPDWATSSFAITTIRPLDSVTISPLAHTGIPLADGVAILPHEVLRAKARLTTATQASRDAGLLPVPPMLADDLTAVKPLELSAPRGDRACFNVLELFDVEDHLAVQPDRPLRLRIEEPLRDGEHVLPVVHDGEFYLPAGFATAAAAGGTEVLIQRLPSPQNTRSVSGSVRIYFHKVISEKIGGGYNYPILAVADVDRAGGVRYAPDPGEVKARVATATRIVLYVHGILGDTRTMAGSARGLSRPVAPPLTGMAEKYDLVLTLDYENISTTIQQTARALKERLQEVGLGSGHGKTFHVVAHSMGGLICRWFIERDGGNEIVQRLIMLGTPNAGSPWPTVQAWATALLGIGLNTMGNGVWPARVLGGLLTAVEAVDVTLDQMEPGSEFLDSLSMAPDPHVPYTIIAGNTSLAHHAGLSQRNVLTLIRRLAPRVLVQKLTTLAFFGQPNDIAVSVASVGDVPAGRIPAPVVREVYCDHVTYFTTEIGLRALADAAAD